MLYRRKQTRSISQVTVKLTSTETPRRLPAWGEAGDYLEYWGTGEELGVLKSKGVASQVYCSPNSPRPGSPAKSPQA
ncbi:hypothetical protein E2C01_045097 [Portunus trituberculatus]|uniref:Uncharacterized protein n=1 Tax=Portunus trituberculatus TaxID=210409 RepID=A0A5B7FXC7_PORTR|nr:hypothetical protein [Portunus trituberculatus]